MTIDVSCCSKTACSDCSVEYDNDDILLNFLSYQSTKVSAHFLIGFQIFAQQIPLQYGHCGRDIMWLRCRRYGGR